MSACSCPVWVRLRGINLSGLVWSAWNSWNEAVTKFIKFLIPELQSGFKKGEIFLLLRFITQLKLADLSLFSKKRYSTSLLFILISLSFICSLEDLLFFFHQHLKWFIASWANKEFLVLSTLKVFSSDICYLAI